jgi:hypothetical protein
VDVSHRTLVEPEGLAGEQGDDDPFRDCDDGSGGSVPSHGLCGPRLSLGCAPVASDARCSLGKGGVTKLSDVRSSLGGCAVSSCSGGTGVEPYAGELLPVMQSVSMLGILIAGIGGFIVVASWDARPGAHHRKAINILAYILIGAGIAVFVVGIVR